MILITGCTIIALMMLLYISLALGAPYGFLAMGGKYDKKLPVQIRKQVGISVIFQGFSMIVLLSIGDTFGSSPHIVMIIFGYIFMIYFLINTGLNLLSKSKYEKIIMTPLALFLSFSFAYYLFT